MMSHHLLHATHASLGAGQERRPLRPRTKAQADVDFVCGGWRDESEAVRVVVAVETTFV